MDGKSYHMDKWEKAGNENDATSDNEKVPNITRGKPYSCIKCSSVEAKPNVLSSAALPQSSNFIESQTERIATLKVRNTFDSKVNTCPFDYESRLENGLIHQ